MKMTAYKKMKSNKKYITKNKIYGNCEIYSLDGHLCCRCQEKRIQWYLDRGLAEKLSENSIKLNFVTTGYMDVNDTFSFEKRENKCVVCGTEDELCSHHVIPKMYRRWFPKEMKDRNSHDIVVMCRDCHSEYENYAFKLKGIISYVYDIPLKGTGDATKISKLAYGLYNYGNLMSEDVKEKHINTIESFIKTKVTEDILKKLSKNSCRPENNEYIHGKLVMGRVKDYQRFAEIWRSHFIRCAEPKFMTPYWSVNRPLYRKLSK
jgi:hypothetical protein